MGRSITTVPKREINTFVNRMRQAQFSTSIGSNHALLTALGEITQFSADEIDKAISGSGWIMVDRSDEMSSGYFGAAFYHSASNSFVIVNRPTQADPIDWRDIIADGLGSLRLPIQQQADAIMFKQEALSMAKAMGINFENLYFPGFSLGVALAHAQMMHTLLDPNQMSLLPPGFSFNNMSGAGKGSAGFGIGESSDSLGRLMGMYGLTVTDSAQQFIDSHYVNYIRRSDLVPDGANVAGGRLGQTVILPDLFVIGPNGEYIPVVGIGAHNGTSYDASIEQYLSNNAFNGDNYIVVAGDNRDLDFLPRADLNITLPDSDFLRTTQTYLPEGYLLTNAHVDQGQLYISGETVNHDQIVIVRADHDGDGTWDEISRTLTQEAGGRRAWNNQRFLAVGGNASDQGDYVNYGQLSVDYDKDGDIDYRQSVAERGGIKVVVTRRYDDDGQEVSVSDDVTFNGVNMGSIGAAFGSSLSTVLFDDSLGQSLGSVLFQALGENLAEAFAAIGASRSVFDAFDTTFEDIGADIVANAAGALSSYLTAELIHAAGLDGTVLGDLGQSFASQALTQIIQNIATGAEVFANVNFNTVNIATVAATYIGTKLASKLIQFDTVEGQLGASLGASIGAIVGVAAGSNGVIMGMQIGTTFGGPVGALIGAFLGYIFGGLIGSLFGGKPSSGADVAWNEGRQEFSVANVWSKNHGSKDGARQFAYAVADNLNSVVASIGAKVIDPRAVRAGSYGTKGKDYVYRINGATVFKTRDAGALINYGSYSALKDLSAQLAGGDLFMKRALAASLAMTSQGQFNAKTLFGDFAVANDYARYVDDPATVNALLSAGGDNGYAASWAVTFARAKELGLNKRSFTDWIGGYGVFLDELPDDALDGNTIAATNLVMQLDGKGRSFIAFDGRGELLGKLGDSIETAQKDAIDAGDGADSIVVNGAILQSTAGLSINGAAGTGAARTIDVAAIIDGKGGDDLIRMGDLGNDALGGTGNDTIVGGKLDDWMFGQDGDDVLFSGHVGNVSFASGDAAGEAAAINAIGGNGDFLDGGAGADRLYGGRGSDWLEGGSGVDRLLGGAGGDILAGGQGDDQGPNGQAAIFGGAGSDQYLFGFSDGKDVVFDESDPAGTAGISRDSIYWRVQQIENGQLQRNWAGGGDYEADGSIKGGEDAIVFKSGITMSNLLMRRSGNDLVIGLAIEGANGVAHPTGDQITVKDWFESTRRVEWLRFADGEEIRLGDMTSFVIGTGDADVILGSYGADFLYGGGGDDQIRGLAGNDFGNGGAGNDFVAGDGDNDWVLGGSGNDQVIGGAGHDTVFGDDGDDRVYGGAGSDLVVGGRGDDEMVGGAGDDVFRYSRGDGQDVLLDDYVDNWDLVWQNGAYTNGYALQPNGTVTKNGVVYFDGSKWVGSQYDWDDEHQILRRHAGAAGGLVASNSGVDTLEFGVGVDIQDLMLKRSGNDLLVAVSTGDDVAGVDQATDKITIKDWYALGAPIENFVFAATGRHAVSAMNLGGGSDGDDALTGTAGVDWLTGNAGDDIVDGGDDADILAGNAGRDRLKGGTGTDVLFGGSGDDVLDGGAGGDLLYGGEGTDIASYASTTIPAVVYLDPNAAFANAHDAKGDVFESIEGLEGTAQQDRLGGDSNDNILIGGAADDTLMGGAGDDVYQYDIGDGNDTIREGLFAVEEIVTVGGQLNTQMFAANWEYVGFATGPDELHQYRLTITRNDTGEVVYRSRDGVDFIYTAPTAPMPPPSAWPYAGFQPGVFYARNAYNGQQIIREAFRSGDAGTDTVQIGAGLSLSSVTSVVKNGTDLHFGLKANDGRSGGLAFANHYVEGRAVEQLQFEDGLSVDLQNLRLAGEAATAGSDLMLGSLNADTLTGLDGNDVLSGSDGNDQLAGGGGDDTLEGGKGSDVLDGGADSVGTPAQPGIEYGDTIRYVASGAGVTVDLAASTAIGGDATGDTLVAVGGVSTIENAVGSDGFGDTLRGDARANRLAGLGGGDVLDGRAGDDVLSGGAGADALYGGDGADALAGDADADRLEGGAGKDLLSGGDGDDHLYGQDDDDQLGGDAGSDTLYGGAGHDVLGGWDGDDALYGEEGDDKLAGGAGNDTLEGGAGADQLSGEGGSDALRGGAGSDSYLFDAASGIDTIVDAGNPGDKNKVFIAGADPDRIWLSRAGDDLRVSVIGGNAVIVLSGYFKADQSGTRIHEIATASGSLFLNYADPLIQAMAQASGSVPSAMPKAVFDLLSSYWHASGKAGPRVAEQVLTTNEDVALSGQVGAVDQDDNIVGYSLSTNAAMGTVVLDALTGAWTYTPAANRYGTDQFVVTVTDADGNLAHQTVRLTVVSVNDAPTDIYAPAQLAVDEGASGGLSIGMFTHQDHDGPQDTGTFQLVDDAGGRFAIGADGKLTVLNGAALDYEAQTSHTIRVRVTDQAGASFEKQFTVTVRNVNEAPYVVTPPPTTVPAVVPENATGGTVATFVIGDPDNTTPGLELVQNPYGWLEAVGNTVRVKNGAQIDFEALAEAGATLEDTDGDGLKEIRLNASVRATDGALNSSTPTPFVFLIEDANDAPTGIAFAPSVGAIVERDRAAAGSESPAILIGTLSAIDPDVYAGTDFSNLVFGVADSRFEIVNGNQLRLKAGAALDFEAGASITLAITVTDRGGLGLSRTQNFTFAVGDADDYLYGAANADTLAGQANRDLIYGYGGDDTIAGGTGADDLYGGDGADILRGDDGDDRLWGELGNDRLEGGAGADTLYAGDGNDTLLGLNGNDTLFGGAGDDQLDGGLDNDVLEGGDGNDNLLGSLGDDVLRGGAGNDVLTGGMGVDRMNGGDGVDTLSYATSGTAVTLNLATGVHGGYAVGDIVEDHFERVVGSNLADTITGTDLDDLIEGGSGNDTIYGGAGNDELIGGAGNDHIDAQSGNDKLIGGAGNDILVGGDDSDVYLIDVNSGADEIRNYDSSGGDVDAIGYQDIDRSRLWFSRSGDDLVISVIGTDVQTTIQNWYLVATGSDRSDYKIDFIIAGQHYSDTIDAEGLVGLMAGYTKPATQAAYDTLHQDLAFENRWKNYWDANGAPAVSEIADQTVAEDGTITLQFRVDDDITPYANMTVTASIDGVALEAPTIGAPDANGLRTLTLRGAPNRSGAVTVTLTATDPGGYASQRTFTVNVTPQVDAPAIIRAAALGNGFASGSIGLDIQAALIDQDGSETLEIRISNIPPELELNQGTDLGNGVWSLTPAQLAGLALIGPASWTQDLAGAQALTITAISRETQNGATAQVQQSLTVIMNSAPTDISADRTLTVNESTAAGTVPSGTLVANFSALDPDGDALTFALVDNAGGRFALSTAGVLTVANGALLDRESAASHTIRIKVTDPSGRTYEEGFTVSVNNVNEAPGTPNATVLIPVGAENSALAGQAVANLSATDPDGTVPGYTISSDPLGWFVISGNQLKFRSGLSFDFETLKAAGLALSDIDGDGRQEAVYTAEVKAADGALDSSGSRAITVRIEDANDVPHDINPDRTLTIAENSANGSAIANFLGLDQDAGDGLTFSLVNNAGGRFALTSAGTLSVANGALLDYEAGNAHAITVRVTDSFGAYRDETFTVAVGNVNEAPTTPVVTAWGTRTIQEGAPGDLHVATLASADPDGTAPSLVEAFDPWDWFYMSGNQLRLRPGLNFDFDSLVQHGTDWWRSITDADGDGQYEFNYAVAVTSNDGALGSPDHAWVWFGIEDVNESPYSWDQGFTVSESAPGAGQTLVGQFAFGDGDTQGYNRNHVFSLTGGDTSRFSINQTTGQIYLQGSLNYETATSHAVQVTVRDRGGTGAATSAWVTVNVANVNERPTIQFNNDNPYPHDYVTGADPEGSAVSFQVTSAVQVIHTWRRWHDTYNGGYEDTEWDSRTNVATTGFLQPQSSGLSKVAPRGNFREWSEGNWGDPRGDGAGYFIEYQEETYYEITVVSVDASGLTSDPIRLIVRKYSSELGPVVLDLDGNGVDLVGLQNSAVAVDMNSDGKKDITGWVGANDGLLVLDRNGNGRIDNGSEISFMGDVAGAASDLEGLRAYDTNRNGSFDSGDQRYAEFEVWRDSNQDGVSAAEELWSLADLNIVSIDLAGERTGADPHALLENTIYATSTFRRSDGSVGQAGDVFLAYLDSATGATLVGNGQGGGETPAPESGAVQGRGYRPKGHEFDLDFDPVAGRNAHGPRTPGDHGLGDASSGKVRRDAQRSLSPAQILAMAMRDSAMGASEIAPAPPVLSPLPASDVRQDPAPERPARSDDAPSQGPAEPREEEADIGAGQGGARSALHDRLALNEKKRFQMIEAMSVFGAEPYAQFGLGTGKDQKTIELLTALPDFRISA